MIIDPKLEKMFRQCRERKLRLEKRRRLIRAVMFGPPAVLAVLCFLRMVVAFISGVGILAAPDIPCFILSVITALFVTGQTILDSKTLMKVSSGFYLVAGFAYVISFSCTFPIYTEERWADVPGGVILLGQFVMVISCVLSTMLSIVYKRLYAENEMLKPLKGYPHFDILFMSDAELRKEEISDQKPPEDLTPDELLMWDRDRNL